MINELKEAKEKGIISKERYDYLLKEYNSIPIKKGKDKFFLLGLTFGVYNKKGS